jgi:alpha-tubulin suppressor-like RCC1 family protein
VPGLSGVIAASAGEVQSLAITSDGTVWQWGNLASGLPPYQTTPVMVPGFNVLVPGSSGGPAVASGLYFSLALKSDGTVWAWGDNSIGQLGIGSAGSGTPVTTPVQVIDPTDPSGHLTGAVAIRAGWNYGLALKGDGRVLTWGDNTYGELGRGPSCPIPPTAGSCSDGTPALVTLPSRAKSVAAGPLHALAVMADGSVQAWGHNYFGQLGDGTTVRTGCLCRTSPSKIAGLGGVTAVAGGIGHSLALKSNGSLWAWGDNSVGQFGNGTTVSALKPVRVPGHSGIQRIAAGDGHSLIGVLTR